jgi:hypothetical protein
MKEFFEGLWEILKRLVLIPIIIALVGVLIYFGHYAYIDSNAHAAKQYIIDKYNFKTKDVKTVEFVKYVYSDINKCDNLWFKECTDKEDLAYKYVFEVKGEDDITVLEDKNGDYTDDFEEDTKDKKEDNKKE